MAMLGADIISSAGSDDKSTEQLSSAVAMPHQTYDEMFYISQGHSLKALATLCQGLVKDDGRASSGASVNQTITDVILDEVQKIEMEIDKNRNELNSVIGTPQKSNRSPN